MVNKTVKVGLLGFGTVGSGVIRILQDNASSISQKTEADIQVKTILVRDLHKKRKIATDAKLTTNVSDVIGDPEIEVVVELLGGETPAKDYILQALAAGKHVITANKDVVARYGRELFDAAATAGVNLLFEAAVGAQHRARFGSGVA